VAATVTITTTAATGATITAAATTTPAAAIVTTTTRTAIATTTPATVAMTAAGPASTTKIEILLETSGTWEFVAMTIVAEAKNPGRFRCPRFPLSRTELEEEVLTAVAVATEIVTGTGIVTAADIGAGGATGTEIGTVIGIGMTTVAIKSQPTMTPPSTVPAATKITTTA